MRKKILLVLVGAVAIAIAAAIIRVATQRPSQSPSGYSVSQEPDDELRQVRAAVERVLSSPPPGGYSAIPEGVRLLSVSRGARDSIVLDFSQELLSNGTGAALEDATHQILTAASSVRPSDKKSTLDYEILIAGRPLQSYLQ